MLFRSSSIHSIGNGKLCVYGQGPNIIQLFGPPYSSPSILTLEIDDNLKLEVESEREPHTAVWIHRFYNNGNYLGEMLDFVDIKTSSFIRHVKINSPLRMRLNMERNIKTISNSYCLKKWSINGSILAITQPGSFFYGKYPVLKEAYHQIMWDGSIFILESEENDSRDVFCGPGEGTLFIAGGSDYPECMNNSENVLACTYVEMLNDTKEWWYRCSEGRYDFDKNLSRALKYRDKLIQTIEIGRAHV